MVSSGWTTAYLAVALASISMAVWPAVGSELILEVPAAYDCLTPVQRLQPDANGIVAVELLHTPSSKLQTDCIDLDVNASGAPLVVFCVGQLAVEDSVTWVQWLLSLASTIRIRVAFDKPGMDTGAFSVRVVDDHLVTKTTARVRNSGQLTLQVRDGTALRAQGRGCKSWIRDVAGYLPFTQLWLSDCDTNIAVPLHKRSCVAVNLCETRQGSYRLKITSKVHDPDITNLVLIASGMLLMLMAPVISQSIGLYYATASLASVLLVATLVLIFLSRRSSKLTLAYITFLSLGAYYGHQIWEDIWASFGEMGFPLLATLAVGIFLFVYWLGPPSSRTQDVMEIVLFSVGMLLIYTGIQSREAAAVVLVVTLLQSKFISIIAMVPVLAAPLRLILWPLRLLMNPVTRFFCRLLPAQQRLLTEDEYRLESEVATARSLQILSNTFVQSNTREMVGLLSRLSDPRPTLQFLMSGHHVSPEVRRAWEEQEADDQLLYSEDESQEISEEDSDASLEAEMAGYAQQAEEKHLRTSRRSSPQPQRPSYSPALRHQTARSSSSGRQNTNRTQPVSWSQAAPAFRTPPARQSPSQTPSASRQQHASSSARVNTPGRKWSTSDVARLSDAALAKQLADHGLYHGPVTAMARRYIENKLVGKFKD